MRVVVRHATGDPPRMPAIHEACARVAGVGRPDHAPGGPGAAGIAAASPPVLDDFGDRSDS
jgi:hypothetical protein